MSGLVRVVVATTEGPSTVLRITEENPAVRSVVCLGRTTTTLPISRAYDAFVRSPTGVVERAVGHPAFRIDVSAPIDDGDSWQLGLYLAHRLKAAGRLAEDDVPADRLLWVTGAVDGDLAVRPVERVADKRRRSADLFANAGAGLLVVVPAGQEGAFGDPPDGAEILAVDRVAPVLQRLGLADAARPFRRRRTVLVAAAAAAVALVVAFAVTEGRRATRRADTGPGEVIDVRGIPGRHAALRTRVGATGGARTPPGRGHALRRRGAAPGGRPRHRDAGRGVRHRRPGHQRR